MSSKSEIDPINIQTHIVAHQAIISRMAANSANCKGWCVTLVSAIFVLGIDREKPIALLVALIPIFVFWFLDSYYLKLEREFRETFTKFVYSLKPLEKAVVAESSDLEEKLNPKNGLFIFLTRDPNKKKTFLSESVAPFYLPLLLGIVCLTVLFFFYSQSNNKEINLKCENLNAQTNQINCVKLDLTK